MPEKIRNRFINDLPKFYSDGVLPKNISIDMIHYLKEHRKRLEKKGLVFKERFQRYREPLGGKVEREINGIRSYFTWDKCKHNTAITNGRKTIRRMAFGDENLYCTIIDRENSDPTMIYTCPNCGYTTSGVNFKDGCQSCGTFFELSDLYPCINSYFIKSSFLPVNYRPEITNKYIYIASLIFAFIFSIFNILRMGVIDIVLTYLQLLMYFVIGAAIALVAGYAFTRLPYVVMIIIAMCKSLGDDRDMSQSAKSIKNLELAMSDRDSDFSFDEFEGKIISMLRTVAYSEDRKNCSLYTGPNDDSLSYLDNLVDIQYRGNSEFIQCYEKMELLHLNVKLFMDDIYYYDESFTRVQENFTIDMVRRKDCVTQFDFSPHAVNCSSCAGTFDAVINRKCPHCGTLYDLTTRDWTINKIEREFKV